MATRIRKPTGNRQISQNFITRMEQRIQLDFSILLPSSLSFWGSKHFAYASMAVPDNETVHAAYYIQANNTAYLWFYRY
jgi:hypothetical protein